MVFGFDRPCEILSIIIVNTTTNPLLLDMDILRFEDDVEVRVLLASKIPIAASGKQEVLNLCLNSAGINYTETILYPQANDLIHARSNNINNKFDCIISGRKFMEQPQTS